MEELQVHVTEMGLKLFGAEHPPHADVHGEPCVDVLGSRVKVNKYLFPAADKSL